MFLVDEASITDATLSVLVRRCKNGVSRRVYKFLEETECLQCGSSIMEDGPEFEMENAVTDRANAFVDEVSRAAVYEIPSALQLAQQRLLSDARRQTQRHEEEVRRVEGCAALGDKIIDAKTLRRTVASAAEVADATAQAAQQYADRVKRIDDATAGIRAAAIEHLLHAARAADALLRLEKVESSQGKRKRSASE